MRKISNRRKTWLDLESRRIALSLREKPRRVILPRKWKNAEQIKVPQTLKVTEDELRTIALNFFDSVSEALKRGVKVTLDFSEAEFMHPCGTLVLLSNFDIWQYLYPGQLFATYPDDAVVEQLMQHLGVLRRFGLAERTVVTHERVKYWHLHSGDQVVAGTYKDISVSVRNTIQHPEAALFADCLNEAVANTVNHAYSFECATLPPKAVRKWWMFSQYKDGSMAVAIYDCGVTIPQSLRQKPLFRDYVSGDTLKDSKLIRLAVTSERTRTKLGYRGKGLPEMLEFSSSLDSGGLSICSRRGAWIYNAKERRGGSREFARSLPGTLVLWEMPFREVRSDEPNNDINSTRLQ